MTGEEIKELRKFLHCSSKELGLALDVDQATILSWEREDTFATKAHIRRMEGLRKEGPGALERYRKRAVRVTTPFSALTDPTVWALIRKLIAHPELRASVVKLSEAYSDPAEDA